MVRSVILVLVLLGVTTLAAKNIVTDKRSAINNASGIVNNRPVIGVLSQPLGSSSSNYIAASYIKFVEASGARAVPVAWDLPREKLRKLVTSVNGILLPGGGNVPTDKKGNLTPFYLSEQYVVELAKEINDNGTHFPIWAVCQSFEFLAVITANSTKIISSGFADSNINHEVTFTQAANTSKLYSGLPDRLRSHMERYAAVNYDHVHGIKPETFNKTANLVNNLNLLAISKNKAGVEFVASYEHKKYPFFATQFHPEKAPWEWHKSIGANHTTESVLITQYFGNLFNSHARQNHNHFESDNAEYAAMIYNENPTHSNGTFEQMYKYKLHNSHKKSKKSNKSKSRSLAKKIKKPIKRLLKAFY